MSDALTVVVADDHPLFRKGVTDVLRADPFVRVVGEASDGDQALALIEQLRPRVALLDVDMPKQSGLDVVRHVKERGLDTALVLLTMYAGNDVLQRALALGARGYVSKESAVDDVLACLHLVSAGRTYVSASLGHVPPASRGPPPDAPLLTLTPAERNVLKMIVRGRTSRDIAGALRISVKTVEHHRSNACQKLGVTGNNALVRFAMEHSAELLAL